MHAREVNHVTHVIAELGRGRVPRRKLRDHLSDYIILKLTILDTPGIAENMKNHFLSGAQVLRDTGKIIGQRVVIGGQAKWPWERLKLVFRLPMALSGLTPGCAWEFFGTGCGRTAPGCSPTMKGACFSGTTCGFFEA